MNRRRVVVIAPMIPYDAIPHAGGQYLRRITQLLDAESELTVLVPNTPTNRASLGLPGSPRKVLVVGGERATTWRGRARARALDVLDQRGRRIDPGLGSLPLAAALLAAGPARESLRTADVISLEWSESIRLASLVSRLNPRAHLLGTFHDVQSQLFSREPATSRRQQLFWAWAAGLARRRERAAVKGLGETWVFSDKDARLLGSGPRVRVVHPPLAAGPPIRRATPPPPRTVVFVANFSREENVRGAKWLLDAIWPAVVARCADARLNLVGSGAAAPLRDLAARHAGVTVTGYVEDLAAEYANAWAAVVPLQQGAGVKFKTIEALLHGVPTVTTPVGAEGISGPDLFAACDVDPQILAAALATVLEAPSDAEARAERARDWARDNYGSEPFASAVRSAYGLDRASRSEPT